MNKMNILQKIKNKKAIKVVKDLGYAIQKLDTQDLKTRKKAYLKIIENFLNDMQIEDLTITKIKKIKDVEELKDITNSLFDFWKDSAEQEMGVVIEI